MIYLFLIKTLRETNKKEMQHTLAWSFPGALLHEVFLEPFSKSPITIFMCF